MKPHGLAPGLVASLVAALSAQPKVRRILLFGSRARGDYRAGSDIDLALAAPDLSFGEFLGLGAVADELPIVFKVDLVHLESLPAGSPLARNVAREGVVLYEAAA